MANIHLTSQPVWFTADGFSSVSPSRDSTLALRFETFDESEGFNFSDTSLKITIFRICEFDEDLGFTCDGEFVVFNGILGTGELFAQDGFTGTSPSGSSEEFFDLEITPDTGQLDFGETVGFLFEFTNPSETIGSDNEEEDPPLGYTAPSDVPGYSFIDVGYDPNEDPDPPFPWEFQIAIVPETGMGVLFVIPADGRTLRVYLSEEPRHVSPLGSTDALNRLLWAVSATAGPGASPVVVRAQNVVARPLDVPEVPGAWSVDLVLDTRVLLSTLYLTVGSAALASADGDTLAPSPNDRGTCPGCDRAPPRARV